jgi:hypothetical protein
VALGVVLADPTGELSELQQTMAEYPVELGKALVARMWEASFSLEVARKALPRTDTAYIAGCWSFQPFRPRGAACRHADWTAAGSCRA